MSTLIDHILLSRSGNQVDSLVSQTAANDDHLPNEASAQQVQTEQSQGWNAYDVWRRLIKEARERREATDHGLQR